VHAAIDTLLEEAELTRDQLASRRIALLGAGGAARALVAGLAALGAAVTIYNRSPDKAQLLAQVFDGKTAPVIPAPLEDIAKSDCDLFINCTTLGMGDEQDASPINPWPENLPARTIVFDTIYNPAQTKLLREAQAFGFKTI